MGRREGGLAGANDLTLGSYDTLVSGINVLSFEIICAYIQLEKIKIVVLHMNGNPVTGELCLPAIFGRAPSNG